MTERKLASIRKISKIEPIPNADAIEVATVDNWKCVVKKNEFKVNDLVVYFEIDSWIPTELAPFLSKGQEPRVYNGVKGEKLRTVKLRKQVSQGLIIPISKEIETTWACTFFNFEGARDLQEGDDVTEMLGIQKWEAPISAQLAGEVKGTFPAFGRKTDQERCLSGGTLIETAKGNKTIKEICDNKLNVLVKSYNHTTNMDEFKQIVGWSIMTRKKGWIKVKTKSGKELVMTNNHRVWVDDLQCYRLASDLKVGNLLKI